MERLIQRLEKYIPSTVQEILLNKNDWKVAEIEIHIYDIRWLNGNGREFI
jgi:hypothetical protein